MSFDLDVVVGMGAILSVAFETSLGVEYCKAVCLPDNPGLCKTIPSDLQEVCEISKTADKCKTEVYKIIEKYCTQISDSERSSRDACEMVTTTSGSTTISGTAAILYIVVPIGIVICCVCLSFLGYRYRMKTKEKQMEQLKIEEAKQPKVPVVPTGNTTAASTVRGTNGASSVGVSTVTTTKGKTVSEV